MIGVGGWGVVSFGYSKLVCLHYIRLSFDIIMKVTYESIYFKEEEEQLVRCDLSQNSLSLPRPEGFGLKPQTFSACFFLAC